MPVVKRHKAILVLVSEDASCGGTDRICGYIITLERGRHSWIGHIIRYNEFVVNILEGAISGKRLWEDVDCSTYSKLPEIRQLTVVQ
jgi:hypothetical protein